MRVGFVAECLRELALELTKDGNDPTSVTVTVDDSKEPFCVSASVTYEDGGNSGYLWVDVEAEDVVAYRLVGSSRQSMDRLGNRLESHGREA